MKHKVYYQTKVRIPAGDTRRIPADDVRRKKKDTLVSFTKRSLNIPKMLSEDKS